MTFQNVADVVKWRLCQGCGACYSICPEGKISLLDIVDEGIRPVVHSAECTGCGDCVKTCSGVGQPAPAIIEKGVIRKLEVEWGAILEIWEGYAVDPEIRYRGSSGGVATALSLYCLENEGMEGILHIGMDTVSPWKNKTVRSGKYEELLSCTGSRYSPASPCDGLHDIETAKAPWVFMGKPCDVGSLRKAQFIRPHLQENLGVAIGIFCAGTPATLGTVELLKMMGVTQEEVGSFRYRGKGWPGMAEAYVKEDPPRARHLSYEESWGFLQKYRPFRCYLCPDGTSELADISCGDPWYREIEEGEPGHSMVLVRTEKGRKIVHKAIAAGYVHLKLSESEILQRSQKDLLMKRKNVWGRLFALKAFGIPVPQYHGMPLFMNWLSLPMKEKARSVLGTIRRIVIRGYRRPVLNIPRAGNP